MSVATMDLTAAESREDDLDISPEQSDIEETV